MTMLFTTQFDFRITRQIFLMVDYHFDYRLT